MKALLMHRDCDFDARAALPPNERDLVKDLELETLFHAMARDDEFLLTTARQVLLSGLTNDPDTILHRQQVLKDALKNPDVVRRLYRLSVETIQEEKKKHFFGFLSRYPSIILSGSLDVLHLFVERLRDLRRIAEEHSSAFESEGFTTLFAMLRAELSDEYFAEIEDHLDDLKFRGGLLMSARLGEANQGTNYVLRRPAGKRHGWLQRVLGQGPPAYTFRIHERDEAGARALSELRDRGMNPAANALAQSVDHILSFFEMLRAELAFYVGCVNLHVELAPLGEPICFPTPEAAGADRLRFRALYDPTLALTARRKTAGNAADLDRKRCVIITGANQGGKSTFLRSVGLAQLMMQCGMFVAAESFTGGLCRALFTHYRREEDATMKSGKLDEELARMSEIAEAIIPYSVTLFNESFAATNEREGSEIARQIVSALLEKGVKVFFVTHLYEFSHAMYERHIREATFLRAERQPDGTRTFKLIEGEPLETSYGEDLYREVFGVEPSRGHAPVEAASP